MLPRLLSKARVLLLDDDPAMQRLITALLRTSGFRTDVVSTGRQAIEKISRGSYRALVLDVMTPTEGGLTVIGHLRGHRPALLNRVLLVTAAPPSILRNLPEGVAVLRKPFEPDSLVAAVAELASR